MPAPQYRTADFAGALQNLLPRGRVWPKDSDAVLTQVLTGLSVVYERQTASANNLLVDAFPTTTDELLPEWEETLGLPDPCAGMSPTLQQRRDQVVARFTNTGGQSSQFFIAYAATLGFTITTTQFAPLRCGQSSCGAHVGGPEWFFTWQVNGALNPVTFFRTGESGAGEALENFGNTVLACELQKLKPAQTVLQISLT